jgi:beta-lactamase regulating signal transducer with metallopeptidase domain
MSFSFLFEMSWKSALIIGAALMLTTLLRSRSASDRAAVLRLSVGLLLLLPMIAMFLPALQVEMAAEEAQPLPFETLLAAASAAPVEIAPLQPVPQTIWDDPSALIGIAYLGGLLMVAMRIAGGLWTLRRWTRAAKAVDEATWVEALERSRPAGRLGERIRLLVSDESPSPLSWGLLNPVILLDRDTLERPEDAEAIIAHEMAHIERRDWLSLMMTRTSVALFWFNPLVWLLEREIVQQAEEAADTHALGRVEPAHYAQTLVSCAQHAVPLPANSMAPVKGGLGRRISAILDGRTRSRKSGSLLTLAAMLGCTAFAAPLAAIELVPALAKAVDLPMAALAPAAAQAPAAPLPAPASLAPPAPAAPAAPAAAPAPAAPAAPAAPQVITVPAVDVDLPAMEVKVPAIRMSFNGERILVPAQLVKVPRVKMNMPAQTVAMPAFELPAGLAATIGAAVAMHPHPGWTAEDQRELEEDLRDAQRDIEEARRDAQREAVEAQREAVEAQREAQRDMQRAQREVHRAHRRIKIDMSHGADGMEKGAEGMVRGARQMEQEAVKLRDPAYREKQIAKAREDGRTLTHQELIDAIPKLQNGAKKMVEGAARMRESASRMRSKS